MQGRVKDVALGAAMLGQAIIASHEGFTSSSALMECLNNTAELRTKLSSIFVTEEDGNTSAKGLDPQLLDKVDEKLLTNAGVCRQSLLKEALTLFSDVLDAGEEGN